MDGVVLVGEWCVNMFLFMILNVRQYIHLQIRWWFRRHPNNHQQHNIFSPKLHSPTINDYKSTTCYCQPSPQHNNHSHSNIFTIQYYLPPSMHHSFINILHQINHHSIIISFTIPPNNLSVHKIHLPSPPSKINWLLVSWWNTTVWNKSLMPLKINKLSPLTYYRLPLMYYLNRWNNHNR